MKKTTLLFLSLFALLSCDSPHVISVISYNIRLSTAAEADGENRWMNRREATAEMIEREQPDVLGIQEGIMDQVQYIEEHFPDYQRIGVGRDDGKEKGEVMAIFFKKGQFELLGSGTFWLSETPDTVSRGWDAACNRTATWVHLKERKIGKDFYYFNTHLDHVGTVARQESAKLLIAKIKEITQVKVKEQNWKREQGQVPVILAGDFNAELSEHFLTPILDFMEDARAISIVNDNKITYNAFGLSDKGSVIDHIFGINTIFLTFETLDDDYGAPFISDHYPIKAKIKLD